MEASIQERIVEEASERKQEDLHKLKFEFLKDKLAELKKESSQDDFDKYINGLKDDEVCKHMTGIRSVVSVCNFPEFKCQFRGDELYKSKGMPKKECCRDKMVQIRKSL